MEKAKQKRSTFLLPFLWWSTQTLNSIWIQFLSSFSVDFLRTVIESLLFFFANFIISPHWSILYRFNLASRQRRLLSNLLLISEFKLYTEMAKRAYKLRILSISLFIFLCFCLVLLSYNSLSFTCSPFVCTRFEPLFQRKEIK